MRATCVGNTYVLRNRHNELIRPRHITKRYHIRQDMTEKMLGMLKTIRRRRAGALSPKESNPNFGCDQGISLTHERRNEIHHVTDFDKISGYNQPSDSRFNFHIVIPVFAHRKSLKFSSELVALSTFRSVGSHVIDILFPQNPQTGHEATCMKG